MPVHWPRARGRELGGRLGGNELRTRLTPRVQLVGIAVDGAALVVHEAMYRQPLLLFPAADGPLAAIQVGGNLLPGVEPVA